MTMFLYDNWYVAALSSEITSEAPLARVICGNPVVLYRTAVGQAAALEDRCVHRGMPLSSGKLCDGGRSIQCPYHGLEFDATGHCTKAPSQSTVPRAMKVLTYPLCERDGFVWLWPGDPELARLEDVPSMAYAGDPAWEFFGEARYEFKADWRMILDNLMDLSHIAYVHVAAINGDPDAENRARLAVTADDATNRVFVKRHMPGCRPPPLYSSVYDFKGSADRWQEFEGSPSGVYAWSGCLDQAAGTFDAEERHGGVQLRHFTGLTPSTEGSTHYFFRGIRNFALGNAQVAGKLEAGMRATLLEDQAILEPQQLRLAETPERPLVSLLIDAGGLQMRRVLKRLMDAQRARRPMPAPSGRMVGLDDKLQVR